MHSNHDRVSRVCVTVTLLTVVLGGGPSPLAQDLERILDASLEVLSFRGNFACGTAVCWA